jgi:hypothetical protein
MAAGFLGALIVWFLGLPLASALFAAGIGTVTSQEVQPPQPVWALTLDDPGNIVVSTWSPTATCVAVATATTVYVIDGGGRLLWSWNFRRTNRLIRVTYPYTFAVSGACDTIAVGGSSAYKYIWTANRSGRERFFNTIGTPIAVAFGLRDESLAVSTGASVGYLFSPQLTVRWSGHLGDLPAKWPSQVLNTTGLTPVDFTTEDVEEIFSLFWGLGNADSISDDGQWRVSYVYPIRGYLGSGTVDLFGPEAEGYRGRFNGERNREPRWRKLIGCPSATITRDGMFVVVSGDVNNPPPYVVGADLGKSVDCENLSTFVFDRQGATVLVVPDSQSGNDREISAAFFARTGLRLELPVSRGTRAWDVPTLAEEFSPRERFQRTMSPDGGMLLLTRDREVRMYRVPD